jgi:hypothetical protein
VLYDPAIARRPTHLVCALLAGAGLAGCGGGGGATTATHPPAVTATAPALATRAAKPGEIVVRGEASPQSKGPFTFKGRYLVRFEQYAPENAKLDFGTQTPFSAALTRRPDDETGAIGLLQAAASTGRRELTIDGRYYVDVSFGDFPYVVRFTPRAG